MEEYNFSSKSCKKFGYFERMDNEGQVLHKITPGRYDKKVYESIIQTDEIFSDEYHNTIADSKVSSC